MNEHRHDHHEDHLLEHSYDGIQEYDNPLPRWWVALFWLTIVVTPLYILYYHFGPGPLVLDRYDAEMVPFYDKQAEELLAMGEITEATLVGLTDDQSMMNSGRKIFQGKCATCHGMFGEGGIGPNLTDPYWLHGGQFMDIYRTVREGFPPRGCSPGSDSFGRPSCWPCRPTSEACWAANHPTPSRPRAIRSSGNLRPRHRPPRPPGVNSSEATRTPPPPEEP